MAEWGSWPAIQEHGLLSTSALLDKYGIAGDERAAIESARRPQCVTIQKKGLPDAVIRDNKPATDAALKKCLLDGLTPAQWFWMLNQRTFFWLSSDRLRGLLSAKAYRKKRQTVLTVDTRTLLKSHFDRIELSAINSGSALYTPVPRGKLTFRSIIEYDYDYWAKKRKSSGDHIVELVVRGGVPDIGDHVLAVHDCKDNEFFEIWRRAGVGKDIGP